MPFDTLRAWLGLAAQDDEQIEPLRETLEALEHLEPAVARSLAAFAYLIGRIAHADRAVSSDETRAMESLVAQHGGLTPEQAALVVRLAQRSNVLFGGTADFLVAREFAGLASYEQRLALVECLFVVSAVDQAITVAEEAEIHRIAKELRIDPPDLTALRVRYARHLPGLSRHGRDAV